MTESTDLAIRNAEIAAEIRMIERTRRCAAEYAEAIKSRDAYAELQARIAFDAALDAMKARHDEPCMFHRFQAI
jgi:hypothetical protein